MKRALTFISSIILLMLFCTYALSEGWTCPSCGRLNNEDMNFCGNCRTEKPTQSYSVSPAMSNAWVCSKCSHICPETDNFCTKCGTDHYDTDASAILIDRPMLEEVNMPPIAVQRFSCSHNNDSVTINYTAYVEGRYLFWVEDQTSDFSGKMLLYDNNDRQLRANDFYDNDPGFAYRLSAGETYSITVKGGNGNPSFTLCIGEPREPVKINARIIIQDSVDYYDQENTYLFVPQTTGEYRLDITEMQSGQELNLKVQDDLGYVISSSSMGASMGSGISFELEAGKLYYIIAEQRTGWNSTNLGYYKLQLSSPNPIISVSGCDAIGDYLYYQYQKNTYEYTASEDGYYSLYYAFTDASCEFKITVLDEYGYTVGNYSSSDCFVELSGGKTYRIVAEQRSGFGNYSLFIQKKY